MIWAASEGGFFMKALQYSRGGAARAQPPLRAEGHILGAISPLLCLACVSIIFYFLHTRQQSVTVF